MRSQLGIRQCEDEQTLLWLSNISYSIQFEDMRNKTAAELNNQRVSAAERSSSEVTQTVSSSHTVKSTSDTTTTHTQTPQGDSSTSAHSTGDRCDINCTCCYKVLPCSDFNVAYLSSCFVVCQSQSGIIQS